jgi:hypothetical protein
METRPFKGFAVIWQWLCLAVVPCRRQPLLVRKPTSSTDILVCGAGSTQQHWPFPKDKLMKGYAYIITHPGMPCILWDHVFKDGLYEPIKDLIEARWQAGVRMDSPVDILAADADLCGSIHAACLATVLWLS